MVVKSFNHIKSRPETKQKTIEELCWEKNTKTSFLKSKIKMIDFDQLAKEMNNNTPSPDALALDTKTKFIHFIEFKNRKWQDLKMSECLEKFYGGMSVFAYHSSHQPCSKIDIIYTIICNPEKNIIISTENPMFEVMKNNLEQSGTSISEIDINHKRINRRLEHIRKRLEVLIKYGINITVNAILLKKDIDAFLKEFN